MITKYNEKTDDYGITIRKSNKRIAISLPKIEFRYPQHSLWIGYILTNSKRNNKPFLSSSISFRLQESLFKGNRFIGFRDVGKIPKRIKIDALKQFVKYIEDTEIYKNKVKDENKLGKG